MKRDDFGPHFPGAVVDIPEGQVAFIPKELPAQFTCDSDVITANDAAMLALGELRATIPFMPNPDLITYPFLRREAVLSSKIEGTHTELEQLYLFETDDPDEGSANDADWIRDAREVHNYVIALEHGLQQLKALPICNRLIREMHTYLLFGATRDRRLDVTPGEFRNRQVYIGSALDIGLARYVPPPPSRVTELMDNLEQYVHQRDVSLYHPKLVRIAIAHYQFEAIHPFHDGNGRIGRLLISLLLSSWNILPEPWLYLSAYFERNKSEYQERLWAVSRVGDWSGWARFFLIGVSEVAQDAVDRARRLLEMRQRFGTVLQRGNRKLSANTLAALDLVFRRPYVTTPMVAEALSMSYNAAKDNVRKLIDAGILFEHDKNISWNRFYYAKPIIEILA
jgi:Fic family protein